MLAIYKREVRSYFQSMVGCVFVAFLIAFTGIYFIAYNLTAGYPYFSYTLSGTLIVFIVGRCSISCQIIDVTRPEIDGGYFAST